MEKRQNATPVPTDRSGSDTVLSLIAQLLKTLFFALAAGIVIIFGTIAWFYANNQVQASDMRVEAQDSRIRLATKGVRQKPEETVLDLKDGDTYQEVYYYTEDGTIALRLESENNGDPANISVSPGEKGKITFYIIPSQGGDLETTVYLRLAGYAEVGGKVQEITKEALYTLMNGHILLFRNYDSQTKTYSDWLGSDLTKSVSISRQDVSKGEPEAFTLYWIWPLRYKNMAEQISFDEKFTEWLTTQEQGNLNPIADKFSYGYNSIFLAAMPGENQQRPDLKDPDIQNDAYNLADEFIGTNAQYLYVSIRTAP